MYVMSATCLRLFQKWLKVLPKYNSERLQVPQIGCYKHVLILQRRTVVKRYWRKETIRL